MSDEAEVLRHLLRQALPYVERAGSFVRYNDRDTLAEALAREIRVALGMEGVMGDGTRWRTW